LAAIVRVGADGAARLDLSLGLPDAHRPWRQLDLGAEEVALDEEIHRLSCPDRLHQHFARRPPAGGTRKLHLDVGCAVSRQISRLDPGDALAIVVVVAARGPFPHRPPAPRPLRGRWLELPEADVAALRRPDGSRFSDRLLQGSERGSPDERVGPSVPFHAPDDLDAESREWTGMQPRSEERRGGKGGGARSRG